MSACTCQHTAEEMAAASSPWHRVGCPADMPSPIDDFHGWGIGGKTLYVGYLPGRKSCCLYVLDRGAIRTLAFFPDEAKAREALEMLDRIANAKSVLA